MLGYLEDVVNDILNDLSYFIPFWILQWGVKTAVFTWLISWTLLLGWLNFCLVKMIYHGLKQMHKDFFTVEPENYLLLEHARTRGRKLRFRILSRLPYATFSDFKHQLREDFEHEKGKEYFVAKFSDFTLMYYCRSLSDFKNTKAGLFWRATEYSEVDQLGKSGPTISQITRVKLHKNGTPDESSREFLSLFEAEPNFLSLEDLLVHIKTHYPYFMPDDEDIEKFKARYTTA